MFELVAAWIFSSLYLKKSALVSFYYLVFMSRFSIQNFSQKKNTDIFFILRIDIYV